MKAFIQSVFAALKEVTEIDEVTFQRCDKWRSCLDLAFRHERVPANPVQPWSAFGECF